MGRYIGKKKFYHVNSAGENVVYRDEDDFIQMMNDIPLAGFSSDSDILVLNVLSTHFHLCVLTENIRELIRTLKMSYTRYFYQKYGVEGKVMDIEAWEKTDVIQKTNALSYVLKNPVHHEVATSPFSYPYSSIGCYFNNKFARHERYVGEYQTKDLVHPSELSGRVKRALLRYHNLPDTYVIQNHKLILPESYIYTQMVEGFYHNSYKSFLVEMNRSAAENAENPDAGKRFVTTESLSISSQRISDMEVCRIVNEYVVRFHRKSFRDFSPEESTQVRRDLLNQGASNPQIKRCLWQ